MDMVSLIRHSDDHSNILPGYNCDYCAQNKNSVTFKKSIANISLANLLMALIIKNKPDIEKSENEISIILM